MPVEQTLTGCLQQRARPGAVFSVGRLMHGIIKVSGDGSTPSRVAGEQAVLAERDVVAYSDVILQNLFSGIHKIMPPDDVVVLVHYTGLGEKAQPETLSQKCKQFCRACGLVDASPSLGGASPVKKGGCRVRPCIGKVFYTVCALFDTVKRAIIKYHFILFGGTSYVTDPAPSCIL